MKVLLCDDHPVYRHGLRTLLNELGVDVVAEAADGEDAVVLATAFEPDVVVMDLSMPGIGGVEATRRIVAEHPLIRVLALTMVEEQATMFAALRAGASGYLLKGAGQVEILAALNAVHSGGLTVAPEVAPGLRAGLRPPRAVPPAHTARARSTGPHEPRSYQRAYRRGTRPVPENGTERRIKHLPQTQCLHPCTGRRSSS